MDAISEGDYKKRAIYADFLTVADKEMHLLDIDNEMEICEHCEEPNEGMHRLMRLNTRGLIFVGFFDLAEYLLSTYKLTWAIFLIPITTFFLGFKWNSIGQFIIGILKSSQGI